MKNKTLISEEVVLSEISKKLDHLLALELYKSGVSQEAIGKHLKIAKASVNLLLRGVKKPAINEKS